MDFYKWIESPKRQVYGCYLALVFIVLWLPRLFFQLDTCDEGFALSAYQQLFEHPQSAGYQMLYYNGILVGAAWNALFSAWGVVGFRFFGLLLTSLSVWIVCQILDDVVPRIGLLIGVCFLALAGNTLLSRYHDILSGTFCCLSVWIIIQSLLKRRPGLMFFSGIVVGINVFTRLPNLAIISLYFCLVPFYFQTQNFKIIFRMAIFAILGFLSGVLLQFLLFYILGHYPIFVQNISDSFSLLSDVKSSHNPFALLKEYFKQVIAVMTLIGPMFGVPLLISLIHKYVQNRYLRYGLILAVMVGYFTAFYTWKLHPDVTRGGILYALCFGVMIMFWTLSSQTSFKEKLIIILSILSMCSLPMGSDGGYREMGGCESVVLAFPLAIGLLWKLKSSIYDKGVKILMFLCLSLLIISLRINDPRYELYWRRNSKIYYSDVAPELKCLRMPNISYPVLDETLIELRKYVSECDYLFCWRHCPYIHYLTHTYPYLDTPWSATLNAERMEINLTRALCEKPTLPVVLCGKSYPYRWGYYADWDSEEDSRLYPARQTIMFHRFLEMYHYRTVWENDIFKIMIPEIDCECANFQ